MPGANVLLMFRNLKTKLALLQKEIRQILDLNVDSLINHREGRDPLDDLVDYLIEHGEERDSLDDLDIVSILLDEMDNSLEEMEKYFPAQSNQEARGL